MNEFSVTKSVNLLSRIPWLLEECNTVLSKQTAVARGGSPVSGSKEKPMPLNMGASTVRSETITWLRSWSELVAEEVGENIPKTPGSCVRFLKHYVLYISETGYAEDFLEELEERSKALVRIIDLPDSRVLIGMCWSCTRPVFAKAKSGQAKCDCGIVHNVKELRDRTIERALEVHGTAPAITKLLCTLVEKVHSTQVTTWANRGKLVATGVDASGKPMYRLGDAVALLLDRMSRQTS